MIDATISRVRVAIWHAWAAQSPPAAGGAGLREAYASPRRPLPAATSSEKCPPRRPRRTSSRPEADDLMASII